jgi:hypothetical protein
MSLNRFEPRSKENSIDPTEKMSFLSDMEKEEETEFTNPEVVNIVRELCGINETLARFRLRLIQRNQPDV